MDDSPGSRGWLHNLGIRGREFITYWLLADDSLVSWINDLVNTSYTSRMERPSNGLHVELAGIADVLKDCKRGKDGFQPAAYPPRIKPGKQVQLYDP